MFSGCRAAGSSRCPCDPRSGRPCRGASRSAGRRRPPPPCPKISIVPALAGVTPNRVSATFERPEPTRPATPEDFAGAHVERDVVEDAFRATGPCTDSTTSPIGTVLLREHLGDLAADHHADDVVAGDVRRRLGADVLAVAEDRDLVGDLEQLVHLVGDVDDALALGPAASRMMRNRCSTSRSVSAEVGSSMIRTSEFVGNRLGDLDHLPVGDRQACRPRSRDRCRCSARRTDRSVFRLISP